MENTPNYYAIIPANVRYCKDLEPNAKLLYGEITALCNQEGYCWASNRYLASLYDVEIRSIQNWLESLQKNGFIIVQMEGGKFNPQRRIYLAHSIQKIDTERKDIHEGVKENSMGGEKNVTHNITLNTTKKKQQQAAESAAAFSEKKPKAEKKSDEFLPSKKIHPSLANLAIPDNEKRWISEHYTEDEVKQAVAWATHPDTKIKSTLEQAIKWACTHKPAVPAMPDDNREFSEMISKKIELPEHLQGQWTFEVLNGHVEINCGPRSAVIAYAEKNFKDQLLNALRKSGAKVK